MTHFGSHKSTVRLRKSWNIVNKLFRANVMILLWCLLAFCSPSSLSLGFISLVNSICVSLKKENQTGLEQHIGLVRFSFKTAF